MGAFKLRAQWGSSSVAGRHETGVVKVRVQGGTIAVRICVGKGHLDRYGAGFQRGAASGRVLAGFCQCAAVQGSAGHDGYTYWHIYFVKNENDNHSEKF